MSDLDRLATRGDERGAATVFERASQGAVVRDSSARPLVLLAAAVVIVVAVLGALVARDAGVSEDRITADVPPPAPVFSSETGTMLVFDDGGSGVTLLDLDTGETARREVRNRAGDQPHRLLRAGDRIVVGWDSVWSTDLHGEDERKLADGTIFLPALDDTSVWVVTWPGGRIDTTQQGSMSRVSAEDGTVLEGPLPVPAGGAFPLREVVGGFAYETGLGVSVLDRDGNEVRTLGVRLGDGRGAHVAWCEVEPCTRVHVTNLENGDDFSFAPTDEGAAFDLHTARFSLDGTRFAIVGGPEVVVVDVTRSEVIGTAPSPSDFTRLGWSDDGSQLFVTSDSYRRAETIVGRYDVATGEHEQRTLPFGNALSFLAVPRTLDRGVGDGNGVHVTDVARAEAVAAFARGDGAPPPLADGVQLLLGREEIARRTAAELAHPSGWVLDVETWGAFSGPFSALDPLADLPAEEVVASPGPLERLCASQIPLAPPPVNYDVAVFLEPANVDSCLQWFAVEVFLANDEIVAVSLVLVEP